MDRTGLELNLSFVSLQNKNSSHCHLDITHGSGASPLKLPVYLRSTKTLRDCERLQSAVESARFWDRVSGCSQVHSDDDGEECVVVMHIPPIKGIAQVKFKVVEGTEPTLSIPMLVANGNSVVCRGNDVMLNTAGGEVAPLTYVGHESYLWAAR